MSGGEMCVHVSVDLEDARHMIKLMFELCSLRPMFSIHRVINLRLCSLTFPQDIFKLLMLQRSVLCLE